MESAQWWFLHRVEVTLEQGNHKDNRRSPTRDLEFQVLVSSVDWVCRVTDGERQTVRRGTRTTGKFSVKPSAEVQCQRVTRPPCPELANIFKWRILATQGTEAAQHGLTQTYTHNPCNLIRLTTSCKLIRLTTSCNLISITTFRIQASWPDAL